MIKNIIKVFLLAIGIFNIAYSQYSTDPNNPLVVSSRNGGYLGDFGNNIIIATSKKSNIDSFPQNNLTYIAEKYATGDLYYAGIINLQALDVNGNIRFQKKICEWKNSDAFDLVVAPSNSSLSSSYALLSVMGSNPDATMFLIDDLGNIIWNYKLDVTDNIISISTDMNAAGEIVYAVAMAGNLHINKFNPNREKILEEDIVIEGNNTMPKICFVADGSFYVAYRLYNKLYADYYNKNCQMICKGVYIGHETGDNLSVYDQHQIISDGNNGLYVIWKNKNVFVQRITSDSNEFGKKGIRKFGDMGIALTEGTTECFNPIASLDKSNNNLNIAWGSKNQSTNSVNIQKITIDGQKIWGTNGIMADESNIAHQNIPVAIGTADEKIMLVFSKYNSVSQFYDLLYNRFSHEGEKQFNDNINVNVSKYNRNSIVSTDFYSNQIVVAWSDIIEDNEVRTLAQNISYNGVLGEDGRSINNEKKLYDCVIYPVPVSSEINIKINSDNNNNASVQIFDYLGKLVFETNNLELNIGENIFTINESLPKGEYNVIIKIAKEQIYQTIIVK